MTLAKSGGDGVTMPSPRSVHLVDATSGPLVGEGRLHRVMPFFATATIGMAVAVPATSWTRPSLAIWGAIIAVVTLVASVVLPWHRIARSAQLAVPLVLLIATLMLAAASGTVIGSPFVTMAILPLMWLAIYENGYAVLSAAVLAGVGMWLAVPGGSSPPSPGSGSAIVLAISGAGMGITLHQLVADARQLARTLRDNQVALEDAAMILNSLPERVSRFRVVDHVITYCNAAWADQYNLGARQAVGQPLDGFLSKDEQEGLRSQLTMLGPGAPILEDPVARAAVGNSGQWLQWVDRYVVGADGPQVLSIGRDVTDRHEAERLLADSEARFRDLADKSADVVWRFILKPVPHFDYMSPSVENVLGYPPSYFLEDFGRMLATVDDADNRAIQRALKGEPGLGRFDFHFRHANGSIVVGETRTTIIPGGLQGVSRDVTELRQLQSELSALALRDSLTGLANRRLFDELLEANLARTQRSGQPLAIAFLDLDGFKNVNDTYGHSAGDIVLRETARRLLTTVRGADTVARVGGDEFTVIYEPNEPESVNLIQRLDQALSAPINITPTIVVTCPASIGIADTRTAGHNPVTLLGTADKAMYEVKRTRHAFETLTTGVAG
ncbi:MAG: sensor domain-containing diguanylate cyclase [Ilumatobacteraceae bacterium]